MGGMPQQCSTSYTTNLLWNIEHVIFIPLIWYHGLVFRVTDFVSGQVILHFTEEGKIRNDGSGEGKTAACLHPNSEA